MATVNTIKFVNRLRYVGSTQVLARRMYRAYNLFC